MRSVGRGGEGKSAGEMFAGTMPYCAYLRRMRRTMLSALIAGQGKGSCFMSIITLTSSPVTVRTEAPGSLLGTSWMFVMMPSMMTSGTKLNRTVRTTRLKGRSRGFNSSP
jgi:hypothetical protein